MIILQFSLKRMRGRDLPFTVKTMLCAGEICELDKKVYDCRTGHKEVKYSLDNSIDLICGVREVLKLAQKYD